MARNGKKIRAAAEQIEDRLYSLAEAMPLVQKVGYAGFDESVEMALRLGVNPKHADQMVRGTIILPHGLGRSRCVLVVASGEKQKEALDAGADVVGGEEIVDRIQHGWLEFDAVVATPDMMRVVGKLGRVTRAPWADAESEDRHRDLRRSPGSEGDQGRQGRLSRR